LNQEATPLEEEGGKVMTGNARADVSADEKEARVMGGKVARH